MTVANVVTWCFVVIWILTEDAMFPDCGYGVVLFKLLRMSVQVLVVADSDVFLSDCHSWWLYTVMFVRGGGGCLVESSEWCVWSKDFETVTDSDSGGEVLVCWLDDDAVLCRNDPLDNVSRLIFCDLLHEKFRILIFAVKVCQ